MNWSNYLHFALTGEGVSLNIPPAGAYLDAVLGGRELWPGDTPRLGDLFICCVAIEGFPAREASRDSRRARPPAIRYRWSTGRSTWIDMETLGELRRFRRRWKQQAHGFSTPVFRTQRRSRQ